MLSPSLEHYQTIASHDTDEVNRDRRFYGITVETPVFCNHFIMLSRRVVFVEKSELPQENTSDPNENR